MQRAQTYRVFDTFHAGVCALLCAGLLLLDMFILQPAYCALSLAGAFIFCCCTVGWRATLSKLRWLIPMLALITLANPFFSASGSTELLRLGSRAIYAESLAYGLCMAMMLSSVVLWLEAWAAVLPPDRIRGLLGGRLPVVALMISMTMQVAQQLVRRGRSIRSVRNACTASGRGEEGAFRAGVRLSTTLVGWAMEDSLERADAMRARAWGASGRRTSFSPERVEDRDLWASVSVGALLLLNAFLGNVAAGQWSFYPVMPRLVAWWGYAPYALFVLLPSILVLADGLRWKRLGAGVGGRLDHDSAVAACSAARHTGA